MPKRPYPKLQIRLVAVGLSVLCGVLLLVGPVRAHVAGKAYEIWMVSTPGQTPIRTCARFMATGTLRVDACGTGTGMFQEGVLVNQPPNLVTEWSATILCMGNNTVFVGTSTDGLLLGYPVNVMAASAYSAPGTSGRLTMSVAGVQVLTGPGQPCP